MTHTRNNTSNFVVFCVIILENWKPPNISWMFYYGKKNSAEIQGAFNSLDNIFYQPLICQFDIALVLARSTLKSNFFAYLANSLPSLLSTAVNLPWSFLTLSTAEEELLRRILVKRNLTLIWSGRNNYTIIKYHQTPNQILCQISLYSKSLNY